MRIRTYRELLQFPTFEERFAYLKLGGSVGAETFGFDRYLNQGFYTSHEWKQARLHVIARDLGCDLGCDGYEIHDKVIVHHMNPLTRQDLIDGRDEVIDPDYLITTTHRTHNAIHYGDEKLLVQPMIVRRPGDTKLWG